MKQNLTNRNNQNEIIRTIFILLILLSSISLTAQTPANFSGKWEFDKTSSDKDETGDASFDGRIIMEIKQNPDIISFTNTYFIPGKDGKTMRPETFPADGTEAADNSGSDPAKKFIKWSQDKTALTTNYIMTAVIDGVAQDFITATTFKLSQDGKTLIVEDLSKSKLNGEKIIKKIYKKK